MAKSKFGMMRFEEDKLELLELITRPLIIVLLFQCIATNSNHQVLVHRPFG